jgi:Reverse transcriptase (RNA-dependent DNA polymerase)
VYGVTPTCDSIYPEIDYLSHLAFVASTDPDVLYYHETMQAPDSEQFVKAIQDEIDGQTANGNWIIVHKDQLPKDTRILPSIWAMRQKRKVLDGTIYKWKARLNIDGGKQVHGLDYWDTYAPVTSWSTIRLILLTSIINRWVIRQLDFVQAFPQAPIQTELFMEIPKG